ncbi:MAG: diaminopimelate epimerase [Planctomycetes bacterium]|nr:diaminopimelate epimerase [Planctomycetota bacterium]
MKFTKMHGLGNDYVFIDLFAQNYAQGDVPDIADPAAFARAISDRHTGIGSDGLILIKPSDRADVRMEIYNADGSRAEMCGNGIRCVAKYAVEHDLASGPDVRIDTDDGVKMARCNIVDGVTQSVRIDMGKPSLAAEALRSTLSGDRIVDHSIAIGSVTYLVTCVSMGNPHAVVFVDDLNGIELEHVGPLFERAAEFPERINTHFVQVESPTHVIVKTWERGSGATRACGTGACAVCVAGAVTKRTRREITTTLPGGDLAIEWAADDHVYMTGPAQTAFTGIWLG